jgi:oxygen-independent coproporphyrinogen-3 oxidase
VRRVVITKLICHFSLNITAIEKQLDINFAEYFSEVLPQLDQFAQDGLLIHNAEKIEVLPAGHLLIRNICMAFDKYMQKKQGQHFSKVI